MRFWRMVGFFISGLHPATDICNIQDPAASLSYFGFWEVIRHYLERRFLGRFDGLPTSQPNEFAKHCNVSRE